MTKKSLLRKIEREREGVNVQKVWEMKFGEKMKNVVEEREVTVLHLLTHRMNVHYSVAAGNEVASPGGLVEQCVLHRLYNPVRRVRRVLPIIFLEEPVKIILAVKTSDFLGGSLPLNVYLNTADLYLKMEIVTLISKNIIKKKIL